MRKIAVVLLMFLLSGCAQIALSTTCPVTSTGVSFSLAGSTVGNTALSMLGQAAQAGMFATTKLGSSAPVGTSAKMTYNYLPIFGADNGSLNCAQPLTQTVVVTSAPASIVR